VMPADAKFCRGIIQQEARRARRGLRTAERRFAGALNALCFPERNRWQSSAQSARSAKLLFNLLGPVFAPEDAHHEISA